MNLKLIYLLSILIQSKFCIFSECCKNCQGENVFQEQVKKSIKEEKQEKTIETKGVEKVQKSDEKKGNKIYKYSKQDIYNLLVGNKNFKKILKKFQNSWKINGKKIKNPSELIINRKTEEPLEMIKEENEDENEEEMLGK